MNEKEKEAARNAYIDYRLEMLLRDELYLPPRELIRRARVHYGIKPTEVAESLKRLHEKNVLITDSVTVNRFSKKQAIY